jgi:drug/metabolite transporter (DMT)-like permease
VEGKLLALVTATCFGLNPVVLKLGFNRKGTSEVALVVGLAVTVPIYVVVAPLLGGFDFGRVTGAALVGFILGGLFGTGIGRRWMYIAIERIGASPATAIKNSAPVITTFLAVLFLGEQVTIVQWAAVAAIVIGITLVTWKPGAGIGQLRDVGLLAAIGSALSYGIRPLFLAFGLDEVDIPMTAALIGAVAALIYATLFTRLDRMRTGLSGPSAPFFIGAGVLQAFGFLALTFGLSSDDVSIVYPVTSSAPLFTLAFTALLLRGVETLTWRIVLGAMAVVGGVIWL